MSSWRAAIEAHSRFAAGIYSREEMAKVAEAAGFPISADGAVVANGKEDIARYVGAVRSVLGEVAAISAHLQISTKVRQLGLK